MSSKSLYGPARLMAISLLLFLAQPDAMASDEGLAAFVEEGMAQWQVPGMAVATFTSGETTFSQGFGQTSIEDGQAVTERTLFANASTTKAMVAAGILLLQQDGKLSLDDRVTKHIPELHFSTALLTEQITVRDLLAHRTGLPGTDAWTFFMNEPLLEQLPRLAVVEPQNPLRTGFIYQNTMFELAGLVIERVSGQPWDDFLLERLWRPIGMNETYGARGQIGAAGVHVEPHDVIDGELQRVDYSLPADLADAAGSAWTSLRDMTLWGQFLLRGGKTAGGEQLLETKAVEDMFRPQQLIPKSAFYPATVITLPQWTSYGLGWFQQDFQGRKIDFHTGSLNGLIAIIGLDRASDKGVIVFGNRDHAEMRHAVLWETMDARPTDQRPDWNLAIWNLYQKLDERGEDRWAEREKQRLKRTKPSLKLERYAGPYSSPAMGDIEIVVEKRDMLLRTPRADMTLSHWHLDTFLLEYERWGMKEFATFHIGPDGEITHLELFELEFSPATR